jgi:hypothetical protein
MAESNLHKLSKRGQSVWIDYLSRDMLEEGDLARMMRDDAVVGVTSNPTIFQKAISHGNRYDDQIRELLAQETDAKEIFLQLSSRDVEAALDLLAPVHEKTGHDGFVSWEVDPTLAYQREETFAEAMRLHAWLDKPNLYVKIPATKPGLGAIEDCVAHGKNINVTLIFSLQRYAEGSSPAAATRRASTPWRASSCRASIRKPTSVLTRSGRKRRSRFVDSSPLRTRGSRTSTTRSPSPARAGSSSPARERIRSAACGPPRRRRTRTTATSSTWRISSAPTP